MADGQLYREGPTGSRSLRRETLAADLVVVGGGLAGTCCAITAARAGISVVLVQDRPVLGGNASSEVRLWILGATAHMGNNNRWAREGGVVDEVMVENLYRNPEGNAVLFDTILLEKVHDEPNITLLLNTSVNSLTKQDDEHIESVTAFCSQNSTEYVVSAPLFCDASGDGVVGYLSGAAFRVGAEARDEFGEGLAPGAEFGALLGHSIYFYSKDIGRPVPYVPPSYALDDIGKIPRYRTFNTNLSGCKLWWIEYGGRMDTVHDTETIKWELWKVVYGVWDHLKNSGEFPEAENLTLEWVGAIPGKRESRRFEGHYMLKQQDVVEQRQHPDAVAHGGWSIDLHPADGVYAEGPGSVHWHARGVYQIPFRCTLSANVSNLFLTGRIISASHVAFGTTRVMATGATTGQAVGMAAALCTSRGLTPAQLLEPTNVELLQRRLLRTGQHIPGVRLNDPDDLTRSAAVAASSSLHVAELADGGPPRQLSHPWAQLIPVTAGLLPAVTFTVDVEQATTLTVQIRTSDRPDNYTPDVVVDEQTFELAAGDGQQITVETSASCDESRYVFWCLSANDHVAVHTSNERLSGLLTVVHKRTQQPVGDNGTTTLELWTPERRPGGHNFAMRIEPPVEVFEPDNVRNGFSRPTSGPNSWVPAADDGGPTLTVNWPEPQSIARIELAFDTDFDHAMESVLMNHGERVMPFCVTSYRVRDTAGRVIAERSDNHQTQNVLVFDPPISTAGLTVEVDRADGGAPPALLALRCYA